jgi:phosphoglycolate phosphatase-like HAD superfamily hydrolase
MNLAIFDVDGTLTETDHVDDICFVRALADAHGITNISTDWAGYPHTTDSAIMSYVFQESLNRSPAEDELQKFKCRFVTLLEEHRATDASLFAEITGAAYMLRRLNQEPEWRVAIASGGWRVSATLKLRVAGMDVDEFPAAFADDGFSREEILRSAILKSEKRYHEAGFERVVSIGDGLWDVRTARNLNFAFLGIGTGDRKEKLLRAGATHVLKDFSDYDKLISCLNDAEVPLKERDNA